MSKKPGPLAPRLTALRLAHITDGDPEALESHDNYEGERFASADLSERDLAGITFSECELVDLTAHSTELRGASILDTRIERLNAPVLSAARSRFRDVEITASRIGSAELFESDVRSVHFSHCKLGFVNLRGARLEDVLFTNCTIDELDLGGASVKRVAFVDTQLTGIDVTRATLADVDLRSLELRSITGLEGLRGATINSYQLAELASVLAANLGILVEE
ncbi:pentapeptide repeat-containing protein [Salinibacterium hongtaonis]|uniref:Pentapeptide repeat-containing protein n=1 Tax=Homoserinimonas hongtaonis TaxID=2079791 RepID=A0A2U1T1C9_9MICO|nr:pentapeptide repeat-containing protein [Salinibacterium hongtaonis]PWB97682.1 pentapeptide repeat-containing protein [Salinibacterium hongtaonis]